MSKHNLKKNNSRLSGDLSGDLVICLSGDSQFLIKFDTSHVTMRNYKSCSYLQLAIELP